VENTNNGMGDAKALIELLLGNTHFGKKVSFLSLPRIKNCFYLSHVKNPLGSLFQSSPLLLTMNISMMQLFATRIT